MMLMRLKREKMAPNGQITLQKGRLERMEKTTTRRRMASFTKKSSPTMRRISGFMVTHGIPAMRVPTGQSLENQGAKVIKGMMSTSPRSIA